MVASTDKPFAPRNKKAEKRELAKNKILTATLDLIADSGLASLSHRAIASAAGVQLAMTTYYFGTLENIIESAFDAFVTQTQVNRDRIGAAADSIYYRYAEQGTVGENIRGYIDELAELVTEYIDTEVAEHQRQLAVQCQFLFEQNLTEALALKVRALNESLFDIAERTTVRLCSAEPRVDAQLLVHVIRQYELASVSAGGNYDRSQIQLGITRLLTGFSLQCQ